MQHTSVMITSNVENEHNEKMSLLRRVMLLFNIIIVM